MSIALKQVFNKDKTFRPKRKFEPGTQRFELHKRAQASLNSGVDLRAAVQLPSGEDQNDWVAVHVVDFFNRINLIYGTICEFCTERTCPVMSGGPKYEYRWQDDLKYKKPTALPAPQYMNLLMDWIEVQINNEDIFPTCVGVPFPKNFLQICKKILCRLFRVFVHVYIHHFDRVIVMGAEAHVNTCYKHFYYFVTEMNLIDRKELEPLAKIEEKAIYECCSSRNMYVNIARNTLKKLRDQDVSGSSNNNKTTGLKKNEMKNASRKMCCRCGKIYGVTPAGKHSSKEECHYHFGRLVSHKVLGGSERRYSCCEGVLGSPGCQVTKLHVHDQKENLEGFVKTFVKFPPHSGNHGVYAVHCEMCYTAEGLELTQVTVVDPSLQVVYHTFVKPDEEVIDPNTRISGVVEDDLKDTKTSIRDVQATLLNLFSADAVLIGHSFERNLYALKLIHTLVVDTTVMFPHRLGLPHKRSLKSMVADYLWRIIQDDGHNSSENATACMELVLWKVKDDLKGKK
ncbi:MOB kinase activator 3B isoform X4 [Kogia breviceps]|uniref:MOB kinase activator 3B isoform X4 n=1 Tax=Kogia breviceps TaxID=27615 RepID=UPI0034D1EDCF